jgi:nucleoside-diphosphate-sugar epimerase
LKTKKRSLVTGATGFIGSFLTETLLHRGDDVICLVRESSDTSWLETQKVKLVLVDYSRRPSLDPVVDGIDQVYHLAAVINGRDWDTYHRSNVVATKNLLDACCECNPNLEMFMLVSSIAAAGPSPPGEKLAEDAPCRPVSSYGKSKQMAEKAVLEKAEDIPVTVVRPPNVLGPRQRELFQAIRAGKKRVFPRLGTGQPQTSLVYVEDLVEAMLLISDTPGSNGQIYYVVHPEDYSWRSITAELKTQLGVRGPVFTIPYWLQYGAASVSELISGALSTSPPLTRRNIKSARDHYWLFDGSKLKRDFGYTPPTDMPAAIEKTLTWYRDHRLI